MRFRPTGFGILWLALGAVALGAMFCGARFAPPSFACSPSTYGVRCEARGVRSEAVRWEVWPPGSEHHADVGRGLVSYLEASPGDVVLMLWRGREVAHIVHEDRRAGGAR